MRVECDKTLQQVQLTFGDVALRVFLQRHALKLGESRLHFCQFECIGPLVLVRRTEDAEDLEDLVDLAVPHEKRSLLQHLGEDATRAPDVDAERVVLRTKQDLGASVPEGDDLVSVRLDRESEGSGQAKIGELDCLAVAANEQVLWLQVSVENAVRMQENERLQNLIQEALTLGVREGFADFLHVFL